MFIVANWGWPQWVYAIFTILGLWVSLVNSGKYVKRPSGAGACFSVFLVFFIYAAGGFFDEIHWPQITYIVLFIISTAIRLSDDSLYREESFIGTLTGEAVRIFLLANGGFFRWPHKQQLNAHFRPTRRVGFLYSIFGQNMSVIDLFDYLWYNYIVH